MEAGSAGSRLLMLASSQLSQPWFFYVMSLLCIEFGYVMVFFRLIGIYECSLVVFSFFG